MKKNLSKSILALSILATPFSYGVNSFAQGEVNNNALREAFSRGGANSPLSANLLKKAKDRASEIAKNNAPRDVSGELENLKMVISGNTNENATTIHPLRSSAPDDNTTDQEMRYKIAFDIDKNTVKEGDYFDVDLSKNVNLYGSTTKDSDISTKLYIGNDVIAKGVYDVEKHKMRYTFTKNAEKYGRFHQEISEPLFIDPKEVPFDEDALKVQASIGIHKAEKTVAIDYRVPVAEGAVDIDSNSVATLYDINEQAGTYKETIYVNNQGKPQNGTKMIIENGGQDSFTTFDGQVLNSVKVYKVKDPYNLKGSMDYDAENLEELKPSQFEKKLKDDHSGIEINLKNKGSNDVYVINYSGKYDASKTAKVKTTAIADPINKPTETASHIASVSLKDPEDANEAAKGSFYDMHIYQTVDKDGNLIKTDSIKEFQHYSKGTENQSYETEKIDEPGYTLKKAVAENGAVCNQDGSKATGNFTDRITKAVTYYYTKQNNKGFFKEHHIYQTVDDQGNILSTDYVESGNLQDGDENQKYTAKKQDLAGYTFTHVEDVDGTSKTDDSVTGNFETDKTKKATFYYQKVVKKGHFKETHVYITKDKTTGKIINKEIVEGDLESGSNGDKYTTEKKDKKGYKLTEVKATENNPLFDKDGKKTEGTYIEGITQKVQYTYEKEVSTGTFTETHVYITKDEEGNITSKEIITKEPQRGESSEEYTTGKIDKDGFTFKEAKDAKEDPSYSKDGATTKGKFKEGKDQAITYVYEKVVKKEVVPEPKKGTFKENHIYRVKYKDGKIISESTSEKIVTGTEKETYTTGKVDKEGFKFIEAKNAKEDPSYSKDGSSKTGNFKAGKDQEITYIYEKEVDNPAPNPEPKKGTFKETHIYRVVDKKGKTVSENSTEKIVSGNENAEYTTSKVDKDGFTFIKTQDPKENPKYSPKGDSTKGKFVGDKTQEITYIYEKTVAPAPEAKKGTFKEIHKYITKDEDGNVVSESNSERVISGTEKETYTTEKKEKDDFKFVKAQDPKEDPSYSKDGSSKTGNFKAGKDQEITYVYEKTVKKEKPTPPTPAPTLKKGNFKETHIYITKDEDGKVVSTDKVEKEVSGNEGDEYTTGKVDKDGFKFVNAKDPKENPKYSPKGDSTKGKFVGDKTQEITYVYEKVVKKEKPTPPNNRGNHKKPENPKQNPKQNPTGTYNGSNITQPQPTGKQLPKTQAVKNNNTKELIALASISLLALSILRRKRNNK